jgi:hypothetical protein
MLSRAHARLAGHAMPAVTAITTSHAAWTGFLAGVLSAYLVLVCQAWVEAKRAYWQRLTLVALCDADEPVSPDDVNDGIRTHVFRTHERLVPREFVPAARTLRRLVKRGCVVAREPAAGEVRYVIAPVGRRVLAADPRIVLWVDVRVSPAQSSAAVMALAAAASMPSRYRVDRNPPAARYEHEVSVSDWWKRDVDEVLCQAGVTVLVSRQRIVVAGFRTSPRPITSETRS